MANNLGFLNKMVNGFGTKQDHVLHITKALNTNMYSVKIWSAHLGMVLLDITPVFEATVEDVENIIKDKALWKSLVIRKGGMDSEIYDLILVPTRDEDKQKIKQIQFLALSESILVMARKNSGELINAG